MEAVSVLASEDCVSQESNIGVEAENLPAGSVQDSSAFEAFFLQNYGRVVAVLYRIVGDRAQAEELAGDVFMKLYRNPLPPNRGHNVGGWLYRTATRLGIDALRAAASRQRYEHQAGLIAHDADVSGTPLDDVLRAEDRTWVRKALAQLKPAQAQLLLLRHSGLSYKELAQALEVNANSVGTLLARAATDFERCYRDLQREKSK